MSTLTATPIETDIELEEASLDQFTAHQHDLHVVQQHHATTTSDGLVLPLGSSSEPISISTHSPQHSSTPAPAPSSPPPGSCGTSSMSPSNNGVVGGLHPTSLMQSSPPPHSYRNSRAYRHFKNPPQPHMCIRTTTEAGEELFINVLSWTRIVIPQEPSDPIPLYGGMRVPPGSPRSPPIVFAVMANPEVLKDSGRHSKDPEERRAMVELMCDFVEAMNPGVKLVRNAVILKDRDISGELKDVWNAVQAQRDREREEQIMQQRQQQHYHNITTQQMFPKSAEAVQNDNQNPEEVRSRDEMESTANGTTPPPSVLSALSQQVDNKTTASEHQQMASNANRSNESIASTGGDKLISGGKTESPIHTQQNVSFESNDQTDASNSKSIPKTEVSAKTNTANASNNATASDSAILPATNHKTATTTSPTSPTNVTQTTTTTAAAGPTMAATTTTITTPPPKKDKLGGFLPNGCIFPRFKNNKHKDKDKEKEKDTKPKDKEKTLLNALKKSKDKKVAPIEQAEKASPDAVDVKSQYEKNCINLESEVQKLDLNKIDTTTSNDNMFIKLKVSATSAAAK